MTRDADRLLRNFYALTVLRQSSLPTPLGKFTIRWSIEEELVNASSLCARSRFRARPDGCGAGVSYERELRRNREPGPIGDPLSDQPHRQRQQDQRRSLRSQLHRQLALQSLQRPPTVRRRHQGRPGDRDHGQQVQRAELQDRPGGRLHVLQGDVHGDERERLVRREVHDWLRVRRQAAPVHVHERQGHVHRDCRDFDFVTPCSSRWGPGPVAVLTFGPPSRGAPTPTRSCPAACS